MADPTNLPAQQQSYPNNPTAMVDERRMVTDSWRYFFIALWNRTGGASGGTVIGPTTSTAGNVAAFANNGGTGLLDTGYSIGTTGHKLVAADGANQFSAAQRVPVGSAAAPGLAIGPGANGFYSPGIGQLGLSLLGVLRMLWNGSVATLFGSLEVSTTITADVALLTPTLELSPVLFAALPATPAFGMLAAVSDSTVNTWGSVIVGSGANQVLAFYNGTAWTVAAK